MPSSPLLFKLIEPVATRKLEYSKRATPALQKTKQTKAAIAKDSSSDSDDGHPGDTTMTEAGPSVEPTRVLRQEISTTAAKAKAPTEKTPTFSINVLRKAPASKTKKTSVPDMVSSPLSSDVDQTGSTTPMAVSSRAPAVAPTSISSPLPSLSKPTRQSTRTRPQATVMPTAPAQPKTAAKRKRADSRPKDQSGSTLPAPGELRGMYHIQISI